MMHEDRLGYTGKGVLPQDRAKERVLCSTPQPRAT